MKHRIRRAWPLIGVVSHAALLAGLCALALYEGQSVALLLLAAVNGSVITWLLIGTKEE